jgi:hypothetical protein
VTTEIQVTPPDLLLAQKFTALCLRKRPKGRDFYDIVFLLAQSIKPNYDYLRQKLGVNTSTELKEKVKELCAKVDLIEMAKDVQPFLFYPNDEKKVRLFEKIIEQAIL